MERSVKIIDGKYLSDKIMEKLRVDVEKFTKIHSSPPGLAIILSGENSSGKAYAKQKKKACRKAGIESFEFHLPQNCKEEDFLRQIEELNKDDRVNGIILQLPLTDRFLEEKIIEAIDPRKDIDGVHPLNLGRIITGSPYHYPCTPLGIYYMLQMEKIDLAGKHVVIVGRSNIVGKPMAAMFLRKESGSTVTVCHSKTVNLPYHTLQADILIVSMGKPEFIKAHMVKEGAVVIDVGINFIPDETLKSGTRLVGDVAFQEICDKVSAITPVPGGVGPMTMAMLMQNTFNAAAGHFMKLDWHSLGFMTEDLNKRTTSVIL